MPFLPPRHLLTRIMQPLLVVWVMLSGSQAWGKLISERIPLTLTYNFLPRTFNGAGQDGGFFWGTNNHWNDQLVAAQQDRNLTHDDYFNVTFDWSLSAQHGPLRLEFNPFAEYLNDYDMASALFTGSRRISLYGDNSYPNLFSGEINFAATPLPPRISVWTGGMINLSPFDVGFEHVRFVVDGSQEWQVVNGGFDFDGGGLVSATLEAIPKISNLPSIVSSAIFNGGNINSLTNPTTVTNNHTVTILGGNNVTINFLTGSGTFTWAQRAGFANPGAIVLYQAGAFSGTIDTTTGTAPGTLRLRSTSDSVNTFNGRITGAGNVIVDSSYIIGGTVANTFTGELLAGSGELVLTNTALNGAVTGSALRIGGTVKLGRSHQIADQVPIFINNGTLDLLGQLEAVGRLDLTRSNVTGAGRLTLTQGSIISRADTRDSIISSELGFNNLATVVEVEGGDVQNPGGLVISGAISNGSLIKRGTGTLSLSGNNLISSITVEAGTIIMAHNAAFGSQGTEAFVINGGTLKLGGSFNTLSSGRVFSIQAGGGVIDTNGKDLVIGTAVTGGGSLIKLGTGTLSLAGDSTLGAVEVRDGVLLMRPVAGSAAFGAITLTRGSLRVDGTTALAPTATWNLVSGNAHPNHGYNLNTIDTGSGATLTMPGVISGSGGLTKTGAGTLALTGANTYTGTTYIQAGTLRISSSAGLGGSSTLLFDGSSQLVLDGSVSFGGEIASLNGSASIDTNGHSFVSNGDINFQGSLQKFGAGELRISAAKTFFGSQFDIYGGALALEAAPSVGTASIALNGGTLRLLNPMNLTVPVNGNAAGSAIDTGANNVTLSGALGGDLTKQGAGKLTVAANDNVSFGNLTVAGGLVEFTTAASLAGTIILDGGGLKWATGSSADISSRLRYVNAGGGTLDLGANNVTFASAFDFAGSVIKTGTGRLTLTADNRFLGGIVVQGGALAFNYAQSHTFAPVISGAGAVVHLGASALTLSGANTFTGGLTVSGGGDLIITDGGTPGAGAVDLQNGGLIFDQALDATFSGTISGTGSLVKNGLGTLTLAGANTFTGGVTVNSSTLVTAHATALGTGGNLTLNAATLRASTSLTLSASRNISLNNSSVIETASGTVLTLNGIVSGGTWTKNGAGTLVLGNANTFTGTPTINGGTLATANLNALGSSGSLVLDAGTLRADASLNLAAGYGVTLQNGGSIAAAAGATITLAGVLSGGPLIKNGAGALLLTNTNTFTGGIVLNGGTLTGRLAALPGNVSGTGGTLRVDEGVSAAWNVQVSGGVSQEFINSTTAFGVMNLDTATRFTHTGSTLINGGVLVNLNAANTLSSLSPLIVNGQLDLAGGSQTVASLSGSGLIYSFNANPVTATLATGGDDASTTFSGILADNTGFGAGKLALWKTGNGELTLTNANTFTGGIIVSGNGTLYGTQAAAFSTTGDITLSNGNLRTGVTMTFGTSRLISLQGSGNTFNVDAGTRLTIDSVLSGGPLLTKSGAGTLVLTNANTLSGGMRLVGGLIEFSTSANLGTGTLTPDGGGLRWTVGNTLDLSSRFTALGSGGGSFDTQSNNITFATAITGSGGLTKDGSGTLTLATAPTYTGPTSVLAGRLIINGSPLGSVSVASGAELEVNGDMSIPGLAGDGTVKLGTGNLTLNVPEGVFTSYNSVITTTGGVIKNGLGTQAFAGPNAFQNGVTLNAGVLQVNGDASLGASSGFVHFNGGTLRWGLQFNLSSVREITLQSGGGIDTATYTTTITQGISGSGTLTKLGTGILALNGVNTFTGGIHLDNGILVGSTAALPGNIVITAPGLLSVQQNTDATWNASLSGSGRVELISPQGFGIIRIGTGQTHTHSGTTLIGAGLYLVAGGANSLSAASAHTINGGLDLNATTQTIGSLAGSGEVYSYSLTTATGTLITNGDGTSTTFSGLLKDNTGFDSGVLALVKNGAGTLTLTNTNTFSGGVTVNGGFIAFTTNANLGAGRITLNGGGLKWSGVSSVDVSSRLNALGANGATFDTGGNDITFTTALTGSGAITKLGAGSLTLPTLTGSLQISQGGIILSGNDSDTYGGSITGSGFLQKVGTGTLTLTGTSSLSGSFLINSGTVIASTTSLPGSVVTNDGTLRLVQSAAATYSGSIGGTGNLIKTGVGTLTLTGYNTFTGDTQILGGLIVLTDANSLRNSTVKLDGGGLRWAAGNTFSLYFSGGDSIGANGAAFDTNGNNIVLDGRLYGSGGITKIGLGSLTLPLSGYAGPTIVNGGTLVTNTLNLVQSASISMGAGAVLVLNQAGVNGNEALVQNTTGAGSLTVTNSAVALAILRLQGGVKLTHSGATSINANTALVIAPSSGVNALSNSSALTVNGILDLGGSDQTIPSLAGAGEIYSATAASSTATLTLALNSGSNSFSGVLKDTVAGLQGILALKKTGAGTFALTGTNTFSGGITVSGGMVEFSAASNLGSGALTLDGGTLRHNGGTNLTLNNALVVTSGNGTLNQGGNDITFTTALTGAGSFTKQGAGTLTLAGLQHNGGLFIESGVLEVQTAADSSYAGVISGGPLIKSGAGTLTLSGTSTYSGGTTLHGGLIEFSAAANLGAGSIALDGGGLRWTAGNTTDLSSRLNAITVNGATFDTGANNIAFATGITGTGLLTKQGAGKLTLAGLQHSGGTSIQTGALEVQISSSTTYNGLISGGGAFIKSGAGVLTLTANNTFSGGTTISGGFIEFTSNLNLGSGNVSLDGGGLRWAAGSTLDLSSRLNAIGVNGGSVDSGANNLTFLTELSGGTLTKLGAGTLTLGRDNTFASLAVRGGFVEFSSAAQLGSGGVTLDGGGLKWTNGNTSDISSRLNAIGVNGATLDTGLNGLITFTTALGGTGALIKQGIGTLALTGLAHSGGTTVQSGFIAFTITSSLGSGSITLTGGGLKWAAGSTLNLAAQVQLGTGGGTFDTGTGAVTFTTAVSGSGDLIKQGAGTLKLAGLMHTGGTTISSGALELQTSADSSYAGVISGSSLIKSGAATLALTGANTFTALTVTGGLVEFTSGANLGSGNVTLNGGGLKWAAGSTLDLSLRLNALGTSGGTLDTGENNITFASGLSGGTLTKQGGGTLNLQATNSFTSLVVRDGFVEFASAAQLGSGSVTLNGGSLRWTTGNTTDISARLAPIGADGTILDVGVNNVSFATTLTGDGGLIKLGSGRLTLNEIAHTGGTHIAQGTLEAHITTSTTTRLLGDGGAFVKSGAGTLTLGTSSYHSGSTTVTEGALVVDGYHFGAITVQNGATLGGSGTLGYVTLQSGATLAPGNSPGTLTLSPSTTGSFDFQTGSTVQMEITLGSGPSDLIIFNGNGSSTLSFLSSLTITANTLVPTQYQTFKLLDWSGLLNAPTFASHFSQNLLRDGSQDNGSAWDLPDLSGTTFYWDLSQFTTSGIIMVVPEPGRALLLLTGLLAVFQRRLRRW